MSERISIEQLVKIYNVEITFFESLEESGLLQTLIEDEKKYLLYEQLTAFERYANLHYDLEQPTLLRWNLKPPNRCLTI